MSVSHQMEILLIFPQVLWHLLVTSEQEFGHYPSPIFEYNNKSKQQQCLYPPGPKRLWLDLSRFLFVSDRTRLLQDPKVLACLWPNRRPFCHGHCEGPSEHLHVACETHGPGSSLRILNKDKTADDNMQINKTGCFIWVVLEIGCVQNECSPFFNKFRELACRDFPKCLLWPRRSRLQSDHSWR